MITKQWLAYFRANQAEPDEIPWDSVEPPLPELARVLIPSLQQFQLGEGASGLTFLELAGHYARSVGDLDFVETVALFIAEEQRHSALLGTYLRRIGVPALRKHWVDQIFRRLRKQAGLECMVTVLVTAEIMAIPYYRAVLNLSDCPALRTICRRILREETKHLLFQASTLARLRRGRGVASMRLTLMCQRFLLAGVCATVWAQHRTVLRRAEMCPLGFLNECRGLLRHVIRATRVRDFAAGAMNRWEAEIVLTKTPATGRAEPRVGSRY